MENINLVKTMMYSAILLIPIIALYLSIVKSKRLFIINKNLLFDMSFIYVICCTLIYCLLKVLL